MYQSILLHTLDSALQGMRLVITVCGTSSGTYDRISFGLILTILWKVNVDNVSEQIGSVLGDSKFASLSLHVIVEPLVTFGVASTHKLINTGRKFQYL